MKLFKTVKNGNYFTFFVKKKKLGQFEKNSYQYFKKRFYQSMGSVFLISSKIIDKDYWRKISKNHERIVLESENCNNTFSLKSVKWPNSELMYDTFQLSVQEVQDLASNKKFRFDQLYSSNTKIPDDSFA